MIDDNEQGRAAFKAYIETNSHLWRSQKSTGTLDGTSILVDLNHHYHRYVSLNLLIAANLRRKFGGRLIGVMHKGLHGRAVVYPDMDETTALANSFGVDEIRIVDVTAECHVDTPLTAENSLSDTEFAQNIIDEITDDGVPAGRYAYETYLRWTYVETLRDRDEAHHFLLEARALTRYFRRLFEQEKFAWVVSGHIVYNFWAIMSDCALRAGVRLAAPTVLNPSMLYIFDRPAPHGQHIYSLIRLADTDTFRQQIWPKRAILAATTAEMVERVSLNLSTPAWWHPSRQILGYRYDARAALRKAYGWTDISRPIVFILAHCFSDAALCDNNVFQDHYVWLRETIEIAKNDTSKYWIFKPHPNDTDYVRNGAGQRIYEDLQGFEHIRVARSEMTREHCIAYADLGVTVRGSLGFDLVANGVPTILAGRGAFSDLGFCNVVDNQESYRQALLKFKAAPAAPESVNAAQLYYGLCQLYGAMNSDFLPGPGRTNTQYWLEAEIAARSNIPEQDRFYQNLLSNLERGCSKCLDWHLIEHLDRHIARRGEATASRRPRLIGHVSAVKRALVEKLYGVKTI